MHRSAGRLHEYRSMNSLKILRCHVDGSQKEFRGFVRWEFPSGISKPKVCQTLRPEPPFTGVSGPEIAKKSQKGSFWGKVSENTRKSLKLLIFRPFWVFFSVFLDFFGYFSRLFSRPPKRPFLGLFCDFGPEGPETPVNGGSGRKPNLFFMGLLFTKTTEVTKTTKTTKRTQTATNEECANHGFPKQRV